MATYVNDLRLKEIGTGESSGTWGSETNTNLELIGEALGFGTEAITTNADTHTTTVADGSTDPGRAMYLKYTGTLDSACTITIAPNTMSRMQFIENGTSGSQNIIISQGTGANVTIPAGDTKAVYLDGAGSGAAVVDAFASLSTVDLKVQDDLTVTDDATIGGTLGVTGIVTLTDDLIIGDGKTIGSASDVDAMTIASNGQITLTQTLIGTALDISGDIDVDGTTNLDVVDIDGAVDMATTLAVGGLITVGDGHTIGNDGDDNLVITGSANENVIIDSAVDIILDADDADIIFKDGGTEIARFTHSASDFKIDSAGDIIFDAAGADFIFADDGTSIGSLFNSSTDFIIKSLVDDKDIIFQGKDSTSTITALTLDMSDAGAATFNTRIIVGSNTVMSSTNAVQFMGGSTQSFGDTGAIGIAGGNNFHITGSATGDMCFAPKGGNAFLLGTSNSGSGPSLRVKIDEDGHIMFGGATSMDANTTAFSLSINANNKFCGIFISDGNNVNRFGPGIRAGADDNSGTNTMLTFQDGNGDGIGTITSSGGTVTYGAFTAHHEVNVPNSDNPSDDSDAYAYGTLVEVVSVYLTDENKRQSVRYTVQKSQSANSKKVLGAYSSNMRPSPMCPTTGTYANNLHNISILGDGHILCNNSGGNISVGDGICTSSTAGIGTKATDNPSMIVGIAQEDVTFSGSETKLVPVQFGVQQFTPWS